MRARKKNRGPSQQTGRSTSTTDGQMRSESNVPSSFLPSVLPSARAEVRVVRPCHAHFHFTLQALPFTWLLHRHLHCAHARTHCAFAVTAVVAVGRPGCLHRHLHIHHHCPSPFSSPPSPNPIPSRPLPIPTCRHSHHHHHQTIFRPVHSPPPTIHCSSKLKVQ